MKVAIAGLGSVGLALMDTIIKRGLGSILDVVAVADSSGYAVCAGMAEEVARKKRNGEMRLFKGYVEGGTVLEMLDATHADVVVDALPSNYDDGEPSYTLLMRALSRGIRAAVASKAALALHMQELLSACETNGAMLKYSASVGGGLPVLETGATCLSSRAEGLKGFEGVLNSTSGFIMDCISRGKEHDSAIEEAKRLGIAEADTWNDTGGRDSASKIVIVANTLAGTGLTLRDVSNRCSLEQAVAWAAQGNTVRQICTFREGKAAVEYRILNREDPLNVSGTESAVLFDFEIAGRVLLKGKGAGGLETAQAVLRDLLAMVRGEVK